MYMSIPGYKGDLFVTKHVKETLQPSWKEEMRIPDYTPGMSLEFGVWETDRESSSELLGKAILKATKFEESGFNGELQLEQGNDPVDAFLTVKVRRTGQYCPGKVKEFSVNLDNKQKRALGVDFDCQDGSTLYVTAVKAGLIQSYNARAEPALRVDAGDFIMKVNGAEGECNKLINNVKKDSHLELVVRRPMELVVALGTASKADPDVCRDPRPTPRKHERNSCMVVCGQDNDDDRVQGLGIQLKEPSGTCNFLVITKVVAGLAEDWNTSNPDQAVRGGDRIVAVNGKRGRAEELMKKIKAAERFQMTIVRPADLDGARGGERRKRRGRRNTGSSPTNRESASIAGEPPTTSFRSNASSAYTPSVYSEP